MLDEKNAKLLESKVMERLEKTLPDDSLRKNLSKIIVHSTIITLQEYEKLNNEVAE